ncbi:DUF2867 domain-containing protein [Chryseobacterium lathyri]|uniref:DUF2867 domain-containing protein n=1 Tax=Chryseobacterium lathyri TaxID=395933 RepID=A0ABT9SL53_9FLAO|nr:DUF2867 domain-containing protein [Chryseobacterium lathyri]MDP9959998.1 hypothetical protein [Chryseobacterium lathyri]MDQ0064447.1 hypothetical protein [Chryseobacterium lathyri]
MKIKKTELPEGSVLSKEKALFDYTDSFKGELEGKQNISTLELGKAFFTSTPQWGKKMFAFRNSIVKMFGLKTGTGSNKPLSPDDFKLEVGDQIGIFKIFDKTDREIILGENDKHLDFRVSLFYDDTQHGTENSFLTISTTVKYHNRMGMLYFIPVRPFHQLIVPVMLKKMIEKITKRKDNSGC